MDSVSKELQPLQEGYGPVFHRIYSVVMTLHKAEAQKAMAKLKEDFNHFSPHLLARFEKTKGQLNQLAQSDEFQIHIVGPWNGPVRVKAVNEWSINLETLEGHLEAGEIRFELKKQNEGEYIFEIESLARSRDPIVHFLYDKVPIAKLAQTEMWTAFCQNFAKVADGVDGKPDVVVDVLTERKDEETGLWEKI